MKTHLGLCLLLQLLVLPVHLPESARHGLAAEGQSAQQVRFTANYDKSENRTTVQIDPRAAKPVMELGADIVLTAFFRYAGQELREPVGYATLRFSSDSRNWRFIPNRELVILVDGERISFLNGGRLGRLYEPPGRVQIDNMLYFGISRDDLAKIAGGRVVEVKLGNKSFKLSSVQLDALGDLVGRMNP
ncbi:MAG TPA: hypothetical protein VEZ40_11090 [Pyrinomonadaceae bacterium]|nr:hypothetical protein [Pyrinomonadaceae bacterium]